METKEIWIVDTEWYNNLQLLKEFVLLVANLKYATPADKVAAEEVLYLIENINNPNTFKTWNVCLNIFDESLYNIPRKEGVYRRCWVVYFEKEDLSLEIEAKTNHTSDDTYHWGNEFEYVLMLYFNKELPCNRYYGSNNLKEFVEDAKKYESYITEGLKDIEVEIAVG